MNSYQKFTLHAVVAALIAALICSSEPPLIRFLIGANTAALYLIALDKRNAIKNKERVPEFLFFMIAALGGSAAMIIGMSFCRHKTQKISFLLPVVGIFVIQATVALLLT